MQADGSEEMEVDINELSTEVLWKLHHFTRGVLQNIRKKPGQRPAETPGSTQPGAAPASRDKQPNGSGGQGAQGSSSSSSSGETAGMGSSA